MTTDIRFGERELQAAAKLVAESMLEGLPDAAACGHDFSEGFGRKMEALVSGVLKKMVLQESEAKAGSAEEESDFAEREENFAEEVMKQLQ